MASRDSSESGGITASELQLPKLAASLVIGGWLRMAARTNSCSDLFPKTGDELTKRNRRAERERARIAGTLACLLHRVGHMPRALVPPLSRKVNNGAALVSAGNTGRRLPHHRRSSAPWFLTAAPFLTGCLYGYGTDLSVTRVTGTDYPPTASVELYFRPPSKDEHCAPIALLEVAGSRFEETADVLSEMRYEAMGVGADTVFSVSAGVTARSQGDLILELDPKNKPRVYSAHVVTGLAARCDLLTTADTKPPEGAYGYAFGESTATDEARCREQGSLWFDSPARCQGTPESHRGRVKFGFCSDRLCKLEVFGYVGAQNRADTSLPIEFVHASDAISKRYGLPSAQNLRLPSGCSGRRLLGCVGSSKASYTYQWQWKSGESIRLLLTADGGRPAVRLVYDVSRAQGVTIDLNGPPS